MQCAARPPFGLGDGFVRATGDVAGGPRLVFRLAPCRSATHRSLPSQGRFGLSQVTQASCRRSRLGRGKA